jgi:hypothetical protein
MRRTPGQSWLVNEQPQGMLCDQNDLCTFSTLGAPPALASTVISTDLHARTAKKGREATIRDDRWRAVAMAGRCYDGSLLWRVVAHRAAAPRPTPGGCTPPRPLRHPPRAAPKTTACSASQGHVTTHVTTPVKKARHNDTSQRHVAKNVATTRHRHPEPISTVASLCIRQKCG